MEEKYTQAAPENGTAQDSAENSPNAQKSNRDVHYTGAAPQGGAPYTPPAPPQKVRRVGTVSFGLLLVAAGSLLIIKILVPSLNVYQFAKFAPAILVVLGIEVLVYAARPDVKVKYDFLSMVVTFFVLVFIGGASVLGQVWQEYNPKTQQQLYAQRSEKEEAAGAAIKGIPGMQANIYDVSVNGSATMIFDGVVQSEDELYVTMQQDKFADAQSYAKACHQIMQACNAAHLEFTRYDFDTRNPNEGTTRETTGYSLNASSGWALGMSDTELVSRVTTDYWYDGNTFSSAEDREDYIDNERRNDIANRYADTHEGEYPDEAYLSAALATAETAAAA